MSPRAVPRRPAHHPSGRASPRVEDPADPQARGKKEAEGILTVDQLDQRVDALQISQAEALALWDAHCEVEARKEEKTGDNETTPGHESHPLGKLMLEIERRLPAGISLTLGAHA